MKKFFIILFFIFINFNAYAWVNNPDLLKGLEINIKDDLSWVSQIKIEIWWCTTTYNIENSLNNILNSTTSPNWVKSWYKDITLKYDQNITIEWKTYNSLLNQFWKDRLDRCLLEWKNYLIVTAIDQARSDNDGVTLAWNQKILDYSTNNKYIKVDNTAPKIWLLQELKNLFETNDSSNCFIWGINEDWKWKNYTINWNIVYSDPYWNNAPTSGCSTCSIFSKESKFCTWTLPNDSNTIWISPAWVNPSSWEYFNYICDWVKLLSWNDTCDWWCKAWYTKDIATNTCKKNNNWQLFILFNSNNTNIYEYWATLTNDSNTSNWKLISKTCTAWWFMSLVFDILWNYNYWWVYYKIKENWCSSI